ncbi:MAG: NAD(P)H-hydrate epimerase, partial [Planctomycetia bacterium]
MRSLTRAEVRDVDRRAIEEFGLPGIVLMENAGRNAAAVVNALRNESAGAGPVAIACGKGNNAGDGFVMARHLENLGVEVRLLLACDP